MRTRPFRSVRCSSLYIPFRRSRYVSLVDLRRYPQISPFPPDTTATDAFSARRYNMSADKGIKNRARRATFGRTWRARANSAPPQIIRLITSSIIFRTRPFDAISYNERDLQLRRSCVRDSALARGTPLSALSLAVTSPRRLNGKLWIPPI